jgi:hypothetical protein
MCYNILEYKCGFYANPKNRLPILLVANIPHPDAIWK